MKRLKIGIRLYGVGTLEPSYPFNVQGDEMVARFWKKWLERDERVELVTLYGQHGEIQDEDVLVHFHPWLEASKKCPNVWYCQNAFPDHGGVVKVFSDAKNHGKFKGYIFTSEALKRECGTDGAVVPFATDPQVFQPEKHPDYMHSISFVGNGIRGAVCHRRYFEPAIGHGLVIYGNMWHDKGELAHCCRGKLPMNLLNAVYTSSKINLNVHIADHTHHETINQRVYDILACEGFVLSDVHGGVIREFGSVVGQTNGWNLMHGEIDDWIKDDTRRLQCGVEGRKLVLDKHTYAHRVPVILKFLQEIL